MGNSPKKTETTKPVAAAPTNKGRGGGGNAANQVMSTAQNMKQTIENLEKRVKFLEIKAKKSHQEAIGYKREGNDKRALLALRRKKQIDTQVDRIVAQIANLEGQQINLEGASSNVAVYSAMKQGLTAQEQMNKTMDVDKVQELVANIEEMQVDNEEIQLALAGENQNLDDAELLNELEGLDAEETEQQAFKSKVKQPKQTVALPSVPDHEILPSVPTGPVKAKIAQEEDAEMEALMAELAV